MGWYPSWWAPRLPRSGPQHTLLGLSHGLLSCQLPSRPFRAGLLAALQSELEPWCTSSSRNVSLAGRNWRDVRLVEGALVAAGCWHLERSRFVKAIGDVMLLEKPLAFPHVFERVKVQGNGLPDPL